jgi:hypothetical protein
MKRLLPVLFLGAAFLPAAGQADGCPPSTCGTTSSAPPGSNVVFVRPNGRQGPLEAYDVRTGLRRFRLLTYGVLSADGRTFVSSVPGKGDRSTITRRDALSGRVVRRWSLRGRWGVGAVSPRGKIAYVRGIQEGSVVRIGRRRHVLRGAFEVEALSPDSRRVFVLHWRKSEYELKELDVATGRVLPTRLADPDEKMTGQAGNAVATRDGRWHFTLYVSPHLGTFVHALDLVRGIAHCVDLPLRGDFLTAGTTSLTLSPDETRLFLASPLLGRVTTVDVTKRRVIEMVRFKRLSARTYTYGIGPSGAISSNGRMLAFASAHRLWLVDTAYGIVRTPLRIREYVIGIGFEPDGRTVAAMTAHGRVAFDAATGARVR